MARFIARMGHEVDDAPDGPVALRYASERAYNLAFVDFDMPGGLDGLQVLSRLRVMQPACMRVLMTGRGNFPMAVEAVNEGKIIRLLTKPVAPEALQRTINDGLALGRRMASLADVPEPVDEERMLAECFLPGGLKMAVQPIVANDGRREVLAVECLLRPQHPVLRTPLAVIDAAERCGRLQELGRTANVLAADWFSVVPESMRMFVNVHAKQLEDPDILEAFAPLLPHSSRVVLEITERVDLHAIRDWERALATLASAGFQFAVDDLGGGHNGLALLADLKPAFIKVDATVVRDLDREVRKRRLIELLASFANSTGASLVAEGVETEAEASALLRSGAHMLQGYLFGRPSLDWVPPQSSGLKLQAEANGPNDPAS